MMENVDKSIRAYLSPEAQNLFDNIVNQTILGASSHIKMIAQMIRDLCSIAQTQHETTGSLNAKIHLLAEYFIQTRGEASQAITNSILIMVRDTNNQMDSDLDSFINFIHHNIDDFETTNKRNLDLINQYSQSVLSRMKSILVFDYSSTVGHMIETCYHPLEIFIAESRAFDGGKPYVSQALKGGHKVKFIPDVAIYYYLKQCQGVFIGSETYYADGKVFNSVGSELVASLCNSFGVPFYVLTSLIKIDLRSIYGFNKPLLMLDLRNRISPNFDNETNDQIDYTCPELVEIPPKFITAFITEEGIVPPSAIFQLSKNYLNDIGVDTKNAQYL